MNLATIRKSKNLTQSDLGEAIGVKRESVARYESGTRRPSPAVAEKIAKALGMDVPTMWTVLYARPEDPPPPF